MAGMLWLWEGREPCLPELVLHCFIFQKGGDLAAFRSLVWFGKHRMSMQRGAFLLVRLLLSLCGWL